MSNRFFPNYEEYKITDKYGERVIFGSKSFHHGIDLVAKDKNGNSRTDYVMAHTSGKVALVGYNNEIGNYIYIETEPKVQMAYFHFRDKLKFKVGDKVSKGQILGYMGKTGKVTGAHLHWAIKVNGAWIDPEPYLDKDFTLAETPKTGLKYEINDIVMYNGDVHYSNSNSTEPKPCKGGKAKVTDIAEKSKHPYCLIREIGSGATVYGWVDEEYISPLTKTNKTQTANKYFKKYTGKTTSISEALKSIGEKWAYSYRARIAKANNIKFYVGTAKQNTTMLNLLKQGILIKP